MFMKRNDVFKVAAIMAAVMLLCACGQKQEVPAVEFDARTSASEAEATEEAVPVAVEFAVEDAPATEEELPEQATVPAEQPPVTQVGAEAQPDFLSDLLSRGLLDHMGAFTEEDIFDYYGIDPTRCACVFAYADSEGSAAEILYAKADADYIPEIESLLRDHLSARAEQYAGYDAEGAKMIKNASLVAGQASVFMAVAPDTAVYLTVFEAYKE